MLSALRLLVELAASGISKIKRVFFFIPKKWHNFTSSNTLCIVHCKLQNNINRSNSCKHPDWSTLQIIGSAFQNQRLFYFSHKELKLLKTYLRISFLSVVHNLVLLSSAIQSPVLTSTCLVSLSQLIATWGS